MKEEEKAFSSIDFVGQCLVDKDRTLAFQKAIKQVVKKNDSVLDMGTGSGVLALLAARAGAKNVLAVEFDPYVAKIAEKAIKVNNFNQKIKLIINDAKKLNFPKKTKFGVVISEMLTTGMVDEQQVQAINNLHNKKLVNDLTTFLPFRQDTHVLLTNANFTMFDLKISMILHLWKWHKWNDLKISKMSNKLILNSIHFNKKNDEKFETIIDFEITKTGTINSLQLTSRTFLTNKIILGDTDALNAPMLVPIPEKIVKKGQKLKLKINYIYGEGYNNFNVKFIV